jgi:hypothetical protein
VGAQQIALTPAVLGCDIELVPALEARRKHVIARATLNKVERVTEPYAPGTDLLACRKFDSSGAARADAE